MVELLQMTNLNVLKQIKAVILQQKTTSEIAFFGRTAEQTSHNQTLLVRTIHNNRRSDVLPERQSESWCQPQSVPALASKCADNCISREQHGVRPWLKLHYGAQ